VGVAPDIHRGAVPESALCSVSAQQKAVTHVYVLTPILTRSVYYYRPFIMLAVNNNDWFFSSTYHFFDRCFTASLQTKTNEKAVRDVVGKPHVRCRCKIRYLSNFTSASRGSPRDSTALLTEHITVVGEYVQRNAYVAHARDAYCAHVTVATALQHTQVGYAYDKNILTCTPKINEYNQCSLQKETKDCRKLTNRK